MTIEWLLITALYLLGIPLANALFVHAAINTGNTYPPLVYTVTAMCWPLTALSLLLRRQAKKEKEKQA